MHFGWVASLDDGITCGADTNLLFRERTQKSEEIE